MKILLAWTIVLILVLSFVSCTGNTPGVTSENSALSAVSKAGTTDQPTALSETPTEAVETTQTPSAQSEPSDPTSLPAPSTSAVSTSAPTSLSDPSTPTSTPTPTPSTPTPSEEELRDAADRAFLMGFDYPAYEPGEEGSVTYFGRWYEKEIDGAPHMVTVTGGSQIFLLVENTSKVIFDFTVITKQETPRIAVSVDGGKTVRQPITKGTVELPDTGRHTLRVFTDGMVESEGRWKEIGFALKGVSVDEGGRMRAITPKNKVIFFYGDSITEGICALAPQNTSSKNSASSAYPNTCAEKLNAVPYYVGYSGTGVTVTGSFNIFSKAIEYLSVTRSVDFSVVPDLIVINHGTNDGGAASGSFSKLLKRCLDLLQSHYPGVPIVYMTPFYGTHADDIRTVVSEYENVHFVDSTSWSISYSDGLHPSAAGAKKAGERLAAEIKKILGEEFFAIGE